MTDKASPLVRLRSKKKIFTDPHRTSDLHSFPTTKNKHFIYPSDLSKSSQILTDPYKPLIPYRSSQILTEPQTYIAFLLLKTNTLFTL